MNLHEQALECAALLRGSRSTAVVSGAGMSTAAGIPDFRGPKGIYRRLDIDANRLFDIDWFRRDPSYYYRFHRECVRMLSGIEPTFTHKFLARLESQGRLDGIVTQNFDGLHEAAGSKKIFQIHGTIRKAYCASCGEYYGYEAVNRLLASADVPRCERCGGVIKPDIVFFGEGVKFLDECSRLCSRAELLFVLGSSLNVYPAALLPQMCKGSIVVVNQGAVSAECLPPSRVTLRVDAPLDDFFREVDAVMSV